MRAERKRKIRVLTTHTHTHSLYIYIYIYASLIIPLHPPYNQKHGNRCVVFAFTNIKIGACT